MTKDELREQAKRECHERAMKACRVGNEDLTPVIQAARMGLDGAAFASAVLDGRWVACSDGLPEDYQEIWVSEDGEVDAAIQQQNIMLMATDVGCYWMPMTKPAPYKPEEKQP